MGGRRYRVVSCLSLIALVVAGMAASDDELALQFLDEPAEGEYTVLCPVVLGGAGELRIAFDATEAGAVSYLRVADGVAALHRATEDGLRRVGAPRRLSARGPAELALQRRADRVRVIVAGELVLDQPWEGPPGGLVGVASVGALTARGVQVQPVEPPVFGDDFTRGAEEMATWETSGGVFRNTMVQAEGADPRLSANPFSLQVQTEAEALARTGYWFWDSYRLSASVKPVDAAAVGLCAWMQDDANYLALRWLAGDDRMAGARRLVLVRNGREQVLAQARGGFAPGEWYRLELRVTPGRVEALIDRDPVLAAPTTALAQGGVGLWTAGGEALFDDAAVVGAGVRELPEPEINPVFLADEVMSAEELFLPRSFWSAGDAAGQYWHSGEFFADATVRLPAELLTGEGLAVLLRARAGDSASGYRIDVAPAEAGVGLRLARDGVPAADTTGPLPDGEPLLIAVANATISVTAGERTLLSHTDARPLTGTRVALLDAPASAIDQATVVSEHFQDYLFNEAPTDWFAGKGQWGVTTRWPCEPGWTFFGGYGHQNPVVWSKHSYRGDLVLEWFGAIQSDNIDRIRYTHASDINATICGDGRSLSSGYGFIMGGWKNSRSAILRNGEIVAETTEVVLPDPNARDLSAHRGWTRLRAEKLGNRIRMWYEGRLILEYTDPEPLPVGRVGLWSFHNELVAGRVRLWYAREEPASVVRAPAVVTGDWEPTPRPAEATEIRNDFEVDGGEWEVRESAPGALLSFDRANPAGGRRSLRITNQEDGGQFTAYAVTTPFSAADWPLLSFDYRLTPGTRLNLYLLVNGRWHAVQLTAEQFEWDGVPVIAAIADARADGRWRHAEVNLLAALQDAYPEESSFAVTEVVLSPPWESYVRCGIGGNNRGATAWIDNFRIGPAP